MSNVTLKVNGKTHTLDIDPTTPLLYILRNDLDLRGPRFGCGLGQCGECTVIINGVATRSCITPVGQVKGRKILTIEGLSPDSTHALQKAWVALDVPQCGYCQSGQLMAAAALLQKTPKPTDAQIDEAMANICRCGTYQRIRAAIHMAAGDTQGEGSIIHVEGA